MMMMVMVVCVCVCVSSPDCVSLQPSSADVDDDVVQRFDSTGMFHYCSPRPIEDCLIVSLSVCLTLCLFLSMSLFSLWNLVLAEIASEYDAIWMHITLIE